MRPWLLLPGALLAGVLGLWLRGHPPPLPRQAATSLTLDTLFVVPQHCIFDETATDVRRWYVVASTLQAGQCHVLLPSEFPGSQPILGVVDETSTQAGQPATILVPAEPN